MPRDLICTDNSKALLVWYLLAETTTIHDEDSIMAQTLV